jgi:hypothetical protein
MGAVCAVMAGVAGNAWATTDVFSPFGTAKVYAFATHAPSRGCPTAA